MSSNVMDFYTAVSMRHLYLHQNSPIFPGPIFTISRATLKTVYYGKENQPKRHVNTKNSKVM